MRVASCPMGREIEGPPFVGPTERTLCSRFRIYNSNNSN